MVKNVKRSTICKLLALDLSTISSGWALYDISSKELLSYGICRGKNFKGEYPWDRLDKILYMSQQVLSVVEADPHITHIVIEEVNRHRNRLAGKILDGLHYVLLLKLKELSENIEVSYIDSDGATGWRSRSGLNLRLSERDKVLNKERKKLNKYITIRNRGRKRKDLEKKYPIITKKHLAAEFVNKKFNLKLDVDLTPRHDDLADSISLGWAFLQRL